MKSIKNIQDISRLLWTVKELNKISRRLNRMFVKDCNESNTKARDKRENEAIESAKIKAAELGLFIYVQGDPRGASLYLLDNKDEATQSNYNTRGIALY